MRRSAEFEPVKALVLDFDGVVVESNDAKTKVFEEIFSRFPEQAGAMMAYHHANVSQSRFAKFEYLSRLLDRAGDAEFVAGLADAFSKRMRELMKGIPLVPGAEAFLRLAGQRWPVYLASVTPENELNAVIMDRGLKSFFVGVYGCPPWTKSRAIEDVRLREGLNPSEILLIGDSAGDQRAARDTGVRFVARNSGLPFEDPLPVMFADLVEISECLQGGH